MMVDMNIINAIKCDKILVEFLRVNSWIGKWLEGLNIGIDLSQYSLKHSNYRHLPIERKIELLKKVTGFKEVSVCEDVPEHQLYWDAYINNNPNDCCNLRGVFPIGGREEAMNRYEEQKQLKLF